MKLTSRDNLALVAICLSALMFGLEISSVPVILPTLEHVLQANFKDMQWIMNAYTIACTTVLMATGTLADRFGRRLVFAVTVAAFGVTSLMCGLAPNTTVLIVSRFLQGMAGGAMFICSIAILSNQFQDAKARGSAFAVWGVISGIGLGFGPIIGGMIVALSTWQWVFLVHAPLALLCLALTFASVKESRDPQAKRLDLLGIALLSAAVFGLTYYITQGADLGFVSPTALGIAAATLVGLVAFIAVERLHPYPMFDFSVFRIRDFSGAIVGCIGMNFSYWPFMVYLPIYFTASLGYNSTETGLAVLAYTVPFLVMSPVAQYLLLRTSARIVIPLGLFTIGLGFIAMWLGSSIEGASGFTVLPGALIAGIGLGLTTTPATNMTTGSVPASRAGMASGIDASARLIALAVNIAVMGFVLVEGILHGLEKALPGSPDGADLRAVAEKIAAGNTANLQDAAQPSLTIPATAVHSALVEGFGWVMAYGGLGVWVLAALSFAIFGSGKAGTAPASEARAETPVL
ncbi:MULTISPECIES: MFS transporter [Phyllobacteriaceae]|jgi:EmrB/QacA subfamily drug resistance transporter|uniref:MFS transporter n=1 Tax=Mesorhizobium hungaricum TaxID=1566387 RepID=A0A1C2DFT1_9HYPH|nr:MULTISPECIES: MFS transporter [Mesorhizobium]MDQ0329944.1 EmrB/QacA subfamily drug resistance transporter [Mesorhizobium sp. YL-MeA3-2017]OCX13496.1 MFS transporter [Mesorhizobium hungaricum]